MSQPKEESVSLEEIRELLLDSPGYVIFAARLTNERDENDHAIIKGSYIRDRFSLEDTKTAIKMFRTHLQREIDEAFKDDEATD